ncbi:UNVERIFIED_CONTAM: hypothetical protein GTU68_039309 [Idotea baltica]|nr:hypothetical protein [Idotea baltica]
MSKTNVTDDDKEEASKHPSNVDEGPGLTDSSDTAKEDDYSTEEEEDTEGWLEKLQSFFGQKLKLEEKEVPQILDEVSIDGIVSYIKSGKCKNIVTMAGAGISTSAGIPDFRSPESGLYNNLSKYNLPHPEAIFDLDYFESNPKPFFVLAKELYPGAFNPTPSHHFIKLLHDKGLLLRHYTQNVDTLEHIAGIPIEKLVEAHGTFRTSHCMSCKKAYEQEWMKGRKFWTCLVTLVSLY